MITYKGYIAEPVYDAEDKTFSGVVLNTNTVLHFEGKTPKSLEKAFRDTIDDYLNWCAEEGRTPEKPFSGKFMVRIPPELHGYAAAAAKRNHQSLNAFVADALRRKIDVTSISSTTNNSFSASPPKG